ncbi:alpha/beta hydrolase [Herbiconiux sp. VKM Ac-1786]|uniref:alpha/beta fold hydrolase n=1 Tax=Herbiconiux sp. VKM Ac-1786 TaxID=2783824 RepID=UPI00188A3A9B|nr:alpha/beta hydrolase [Herbiconiux sp. VKM Ac-1786]MBF4571110.1 alpha/beta hydrolase [Herbiconiux sp. VKM Ac-1786]
MTEFTQSSTGDTVAFDRYGDGSGPTVVFIAGAGPYRAGDAVTTETAQLAAADGLTTLVFDRLGRGESAAEGVLDLDRELEAVRAAIAAATGSEDGRAVLVGHSSGCSIALAATVRGLPVSGLVLWEAPLSESAADTAEWSDGFEALLDAGEDERAKEHYMRDMPPEFLAGAKASPAWPAIVANARTERADGQSMKWANAALEGDGFPGIDVPVLAVYGTQTFPQMPLAAARIVAAIPGAREKTVEGAMHSWQPAAMAAELVTFARALA